MIVADFSAAGWRTSSHSGSSGNCVQVAFQAADWRTSSYSGDSSNCVQVAFEAPAVGVRDSKSPATGTLVFTDATWSRFVTAIHPA
ncbi:MAG: DUF397 domain-containing protein [Sciscionella sp.]